MLETEIVGRCHWDLDYHGSGYLMDGRRQYHWRSTTACNAGDLGLMPGLGRSPREGKGYPLQYSGLENSMDYIYSPWGRKELDTTEQLSLSFTVHYQVFSRLTGVYSLDASSTPFPAVTTKKSPSVAKCLLNGTKMGPSEELLR